MHEAIEHPEWCLFGPHYCPKHNVIVLETFFLEDEDQKSIPELTIQIINHETLHWILCKDFGESVSAVFDEITDDTTSEEVS